MHILTDSGNRSVVLNIKQLVLQYRYAYKNYKGNSKQEPSDLVLHCFIVLSKLFVPILRIYYLIVQKRNDIFFSSIFFSKTNEIIFIYTGANIRGCTILDKIT